MQNAECRVKESLVGTGVLDGPFCLSTTLLADGVSVGLAAARVTKVACGNLGSDTTQWCHSLPSRRFATQPLAAARARFTSR